MLIHLSDRALLGLKGHDAIEFLQSVITNDMRLLEKQKAIYAAHLTTRGKFLFDFFVSQKDDLILIDCNKDELMPLAQALHGFVVNKDVEFHDLTEDYTLLASNKELSNTYTTYADPRHEKLGFRCWVKTAPPEVEPMDKYTELRLNLGVIDGAYDGLKERSLINELGFESLNGVSFNKGCYVGQELTARTKFRTEPKKKVFKVKFDGNVENGSVILCGNMDAGWVFTNQGGIGLALLRTRYLEKDLTLNGNKVEILP